MVKEWLHENAGRPSQQVCPIRVYKHPYSLTRDGLAKWFADFGYTRGAEIGVQQGKFSEVLLKSNPNLELFCVDPWGVEDWRSRQHGAEKQEWFYNECLKRLEPYFNRTKIIRLKSMDAAKEIPDNSLDFVYIDGCHEFDYIMEDIINWTKKVRPDGIVAGHDWYRFKKAGVIQATEVYTKMHRINEWFITDDKTPSFFWVKE